MEGNGKLSQRYLSGRVKVSNNAGLSTDRHRYLSPSEVEPNLGFIGEKTLPASGTYYKLVTVPNGDVYDRYWQPDLPATLVNGITIFDEGNLVGTANTVSKINFVGTAVTATASGTISTITVSATGLNGQVQYNSSGNFAGASGLFYDGTNHRVGIGTSVPSESLHIQGGMRLTGGLYDSTNNVGAASSILISTGSGVKWASSVDAKCTIAPTAPPNAVEGDLWWDSVEGDLNVYFIDSNSEQWVSANANSQVDSTLWVTDAIGLHTTSNVGIATTVASVALAVGGNAIFGGTGIVTATEFHGTFIGNATGATGVGGTWAVNSAGIHTSKNVGIGSTLPGEALVVSGVTSTTYLNVIGVSTFVGTISVNSQVGAAGSVLSSTGSGLNWVSPQTGPQGAAGAQGAQGVQGAQGHQGVQGAQGHQGVQGAQGAAGAQGHQGVQGAQGHQGIQGAQGHQGHQGNVGAQGAQGHQGVQGAIGAQGAQGAQGRQGAEGNFGGVTFDYTFDNSTTDGDPGQGKLRISESPFSGALTLYIDDKDDNNIDINTYLTTIDDSTSTLKGHYRITNKSNSDDFAIFSITGSSTDGGTYHKIPSTHLSGATSFSNNEDILITFARTGDKGDAGAQGAQGAPGAVGAQGAQGYQGVQGAQGAQGAGGVGTQGAQGVQGAQGRQGAQGATGAGGGAGAQGAQGRQGAQGHQGRQGAAGGGGAQGAPGAQGAQGRQGAQGIQGATGGGGGTGPQGAQGRQGAQGVQGSSGAGAPGAQGAAGAQGAQGRQGAQGYQGLPNSFPSGTRMIFNQTNAPTGWTKVTSGVNNDALRVVTGTVGSGGSIGFTQAFNSSRSTSGGSVSNTTLAINQIPSHGHGFDNGFFAENNGNRANPNNIAGSNKGNDWDNNAFTFNDVTNGIGGNGSHGHGFTNPTFNLDVVYQDVIIATKD